MGEHLTADGEFKSDKYAWCPAGFFPMKLTDPRAQDLIAEYGARTDDKELEEDIVVALKNKGYKGMFDLAIFEKVKVKGGGTWELAYDFAQRALTFADKTIDQIAGWSGSSGNWPLQESAGIVGMCLDLFKDQKDKRYIPLMLPDSTAMRTVLYCIRGYVRAQKSDPGQGDDGEKVRNALQHIEDSITYLLEKPNG